MHNREITHIVKTDSSSKTQLIVRTKCSFCCNLRETYVKIIYIDICIAILLYCMVHVISNIYFVYRKHQQTEHSGGVVRGVKLTRVQPL